MSIHGRERKGFQRPKSSSLESLAIVNGILESPASQHPLVERLRYRLSSEGTSGIGYAELQRRLYFMDRDGSQTLNFEDFKIALQKCRVGIEEKDYQTLFLLFANRDQSYLDIYEFIVTVRGSISHSRRELIERAFHELNQGGEGVLSCEVIIERFDPTQHPDVKRNIKKSNDVFREFLKAFEAGGEVENRVTRSEFFNYYFNLSASIDDDDYFRDVISGVWRFSPEHNFPIDADRRSPEKAPHDDVTSLGTGRSGSRPGTSRGYSHEDSDPYSNNTRSSFPSHYDQRNLNTDYTRGPRPVSEYTRRQGRDIRDLSSDFSRSLGSRPGGDYSRDPGNTPRTAETKLDDEIKYHNNGRDRPGSPSSSALYNGSYQRREYESSERTRDANFHYDQYSQPQRSRRDQYEHY